MFIVTLNLARAFCTPACVVFIGLLLISVPWSVAPAQDDPVAAELDAFWAEVARTVAEGDFEGYAATYHPDAVLVSGINGTSYPIAKALEGWREGFDDTRAGTTETSVEFRFTARLLGPTTSHETGMFRYVLRTPGGSSLEQTLHFEALLVKKNGWKLVMEFQKSLASAAEWEAI